MIVDRIDQVALRHIRLGVEDQIVPKLPQLLKICGVGCGRRFLAPPLLLFLLVRLRGGAILGLGSATKALPCTRRKLINPLGPGTASSHWRSLMWRSGEQISPGALLLAIEEFHTGFECGRDIPTGDQCPHRHDAGGTEDTCQAANFKTTAGRLSH